MRHYGLRPPGLTCVPERFASVPVEKMVGFAKPNFLVFLPGAVIRNSASSTNCRASGSQSWRGGRDPLHRPPARAGETRHVLSGREFLSGLSGKHIDRAKKALAGLIKRIGERVHIIAHSNEKLIDHLRC